MKQSKKKKLNYSRVILFILVLALIIFGVYKIINNALNKETLANNQEQNVETVANVENSGQNEETNNTIETKPQRESKAIPLASGEKSKNSLAVLMYHYFYDSSKGETGENVNWMEISDFENQLKYLKENDYYYPTWQEVADFVDGKIDLPEKSVVITIDDGQKSLYNLAIPLLDKYEVYATAFIITKNFKTSNLEKYKDSYIDFESHTDNMHRAGGTIGHGGIFPALSVEEGVEDLKTSIEKLGGNSGALAYPYGDHTETTMQAVEQAGFLVAFTTEYGKLTPGMNRYKLPRVRMSQGISVQGFAASI